MVLGFTREQTTLARRAPAVERPGPVYGWDDWLIERGAIQWEAAADLTGGFPGFAGHGARLEGCQVRVTERFLLVDEGRRHGFGLPLGWLVDADVIASPLRGDRGEAVLRVRYNDRDRVRTFLVRLRGPFLALRGAKRAEHALAALREVGLEAGAEALPPLPEIAHSWLQAAQFEQENVIWSGVTSAAPGPGQEPEPCDVWLTTRSVIWGGGIGDGVLRLSLDRVLDVVPAELESRGKTPALYLACADEAGGRHDLPFIFDRQHPAQRCHRERGALLVGLRSRGIPLGVPPALPQPWRAALAQAAAEDHRFASEAQPLHPPVREQTAPTRFRTPSPARRSVPRRFPMLLDAPFETDDPAAWSLGPNPSPESGFAAELHDDLDHLAATVRRPGAFGRGALTLVPWPSAADDPERLVETAAQEPAMIAAETEFAVIADSVAVVAAAKAGSAPLESNSGPLAIVGSVEDSLVAVLVEAAQGIEHCLGGGLWAAPSAPVPSSSDQLAAHAALDDLLTTGALANDEIRARRCRLVAVGDAGPRLRSLLELHRATLLTDAQLAGMRAEIMAPLADVLRAGKG